LIPGRRLVLFAVVAAVVIALDQWTKILVREHLGAPRVYAHGLLTLVHTENTGAFLSIGANLPPIVRTLIFGGFVAVMLVVFTIAVVRGSIRGAGESVAAAAIIAGGVGNLIDRLMRDGRVTDFLYLEAGPLHTGVFNVADMAITCGVVWLLLTSMKSKASGLGHEVP
jgi:signal peptidase II